MAQLLPFVAKEDYETMQYPSESREPTEYHVMHLNICKEIYQPYMICPYSTYLAKHKLLLRGPDTKQFKISKKEACCRLQRLSQRKKFNVCTRRDPTTNVGVGFMPSRISSASYTY
jgi:hypothetical protein